MTRFGKKKRKKVGRNIKHSPEFHQRPCDCIVISAVTKRGVYKNGGVERYVRVGTRRRHILFDYRLLSEIKFSNFYGHARRRDSSQTFEPSLVRNFTRAVRGRKNGRQVDSVYGITPNAELFGGETKN